MYEIMEVQDISRPRCKRFVAHIKAHMADVDSIKAVISDATEKLKLADQYSNEATKQRFGNAPAHVIRLYVYYSGKLVCQSMWADNTLKDVPLPKPLDYNDYVDDIGIMFIGRQNK